MKKEILILILCLSFLCVMALEAFGMSSPNYILYPDVISGGGGDSGSAGYDIFHTTGQPSAIGESSSGSYKNYAGFWYMVLQVPQGQLLGDINNDTFVDISDVILDLRIALKLDPVKPCSDINKDTIVDISDVILTLRMALKLDPLQQCT